MNHHTRNGYRIAYDDSGRPNGPAIVFSHSLGLDSSSWDPQAERLGEDFRLVRVDTRGHGSSDSPAGPYTVESLALDVLAVADHLGLERFHYVGLSLGGMMALWAAIHRGERLRSAVLCNTAAKLGQADLWNERIEKVRRDGLESIAEIALGRFFTEGFKSRHPAVFAAARTRLVGTDPAGYSACCAALRDEDLRSETARVSVPVLVIGSAQDGATPPAEARWLHEHIAGSELEVLEGAGHLSNLEQPEAFTHALVKYLRNEVAQ